MAVLHREGQWHHKQYIDSPACFHILPPQDASNPSVSGAGLKIGSGPGTEPETVTFFTGTTTLFLLPFSGCSCPKGARLSGPSSQLRASQSLLTAPLTLPVVTGNGVSPGLLIKSHPLPSVTSEFHHPRG